MPTKGFPQLQEHYRLLGAEKNVRHHPLLHFEHNYNYVSRANMYAWLNEHFQLGLPTPIVEEDYPRLTAAELTVWDDAHPKPQGGDDVERTVLRWWNDDAQTQLAQVVPSDAATWQQYREVVGGAVDVVLGAGLPAEGEVRFEATATTEQDKFRTRGRPAAQRRAGQRVAAGGAGTEDGGAARRGMAQPRWQGGIVCGGRKAASGGRPFAGRRRDGRRRRLDLSGRVFAARPDAGQDPPRGEPARSGCVHLRLQSDRVCPTRARRVERHPFCPIAAGRRGPSCWSAWMVLARGPPRR